MLTGGCFCGAIRYEAEGTPFHATNCHCSICRRTTGTPFVAWFSVRSSDFRIVKGEPMRFNSTEQGNEIDVTTCSLDHPELVPPTDNTRTSSRLVWIAPDGLPDHREARAGSPSRGD